jgi:hypothetical protein
LEKDFWKPLLSSINNKKCIPFIGQEASLQWIHLDDVAGNWSKEYDYPLEDSNELSGVAQFYAITSGRDVIPKNELSEMLRKIEPPDFSLDTYKNTSYSVLAELKLPIYITTNYDHFMEAALISRGRQPISDFCRWNKDLLKEEIYTDLAGNFRKVNFSFSETKLSSILDQASDYKPTEDRPLVYHLYGDMAAPESMVLTERDYFDFVINLHSHQDRTSLPSFILNSLVILNSAYGFHCHRRRRLCLQPHIRSGYDCQCYGRHDNPAVLAGAEAFIQNAL